MSIEYYQRTWQDAISNLLDCIEEQNTPLQDNRNEKGITYKRTDYQWFQYYGGLYLKYLDVYRKLEDAYDQTVHPQKRILMKEMLENSIVRMCQVKQLLIRYSTQTNIIQSDYINIDQILTEMKLQPKALKVPIPRYYRQTKTERDKIVKQMIQTMKIPEEIQVFNQDITLQANFDTIIRIIQKLQRGRQGIVLGMDIAKAKKKLSKQRGPQLENEDNNRANAIQKYWRAFLSRREFAKMRSQELKFLGIEKQPSDQNLLQKAEQTRKKIKITQQKREKDFQSEKINVKNNIIRTQEKIMKGKMQEERRKWINKFLQIHEFSNLPNNLTQFYKLKQNNSETNPPPTEQKDKKSDGKSAKKNQVEKYLDEHDSIGPTQSVVGLQKSIESYSTTWASKSCDSVDGQYFDLDLAKSEIRPQIQAQMQKNVDALINLELDCMRIKYGIKKKKEKKKKPKKKKAKKVKIPQGLGKKVPKDILEELFENNVAKVLSSANMDDFIGDHNCLTHVLEKTSEMMPEPSMPQVRNMVSQYIGIPLGSQNAKDKLEKWNWFLFYGPTGTGKTLLTRALQTQTQAVVFDLSPQNIKNTYVQKSEITKLIWSVIICAKEFQPSIVLVQDFQTIIPAAKGKKKGDSNSAPNFGPKIKKAIVDMKKNKLWSKEDRIAVICHTNKPYDGSLKEMKKLFDKKIYFPYPNYSTRKLILSNFIQKKLGYPLPFNYNTLAHTTEGFTAGSYNECINKVLTPNRIARIKDDPLKMSQLILPLSNTVCVFSEEFEKLKKFTDQVTGLKEKREAKNSNSKKEQNKKDPKKKK